MQSFRQILAATDFGPSSERAVLLAAELAERDGATLTLMHVLDDRGADPDALLPLTTSNVPAEWEQDARDRLTKIAAQVGHVGRHEIVVRHGEPWKTIVQEAEAREADLLVLGTHGRGGPKRWLLGSVAERVVRECHCPVLTARGDEHVSVHAPEHDGRHDTTVVKIDSHQSPIGAEGQKYLASGIRVSMRLWEHEPPGDSAESERDYEVVGYVIEGQAELHLEGQVVRLEPGDSYVVPRHARHHYRILEPFTAVEATSPSAAVHGRDEPAHAHP